MLQVRILTEEEELFNGEADKIVAPGIVGQFTVLTGHIPFLTTLKAGSIKIENKGQETFFEVPEKGIFELAPGNRASILLSIKS